MFSDGSSFSGLYAGGKTVVGVSGSGYKDYSSADRLRAATMLGKDLRRGRQGVR